MFRCLAKRNGDLDIEVMGEIGPDCVSESYVLAQLKKSPKATVNVTFNSDGGDVIEGLKIYEALALHEGLTIGLVKGVAASMASVLLQACKLRRATMSSVVMIHNPWTVPPPGDYRVFKSVAETLESWTKALAEIYSQRTGQPIESVLEAMGAETWMPAQMALEKGYLDEVVSALPVKQEQIAALKIEKFKAPPEELVRAVALARKGEVRLDPFKEICKMLGLDPDKATLEEAQAVIKQMAGEEPPAEELPAEEAVAASNLHPKTQAVILAALVSVKDLEKNRVKALVEANVSKFTPSLEKWAMAQTYDVVKSYIEKAGDVAPKASSQKTSQTKTADGEMTDAERAVYKATGVSAKKVREYMAKKEKELV